jgi:hypothetical protein
VSIPAAILGLPTGIAGWSLLKKRSIAEFSGFANDPTLRSDVTYLRAKLPGATTAKALLADPRLQQIVLGAYGLDSQIGMNGLMEKVLNSNLTDSKSLANKMTNAAFKAIARDFNYAGTTTPASAAVMSKTVLAVDGVGTGSTFGRFSGTLGGVSLRGIDISGATDRFQLASTLQAAFRKADGNRSDISVKVDGLSLVFSDAKGRGDLRDMTLDPAGGAQAIFVANGLTSANATPQPSRAEITLAGLGAEQTIGNFSGTFAGLTLDAVDLSAATTPQQVAAALQAAFREADGKGTSIAVSARGNVITVTDTKGRGGASDVSFATTPGGATASLTATTRDASGVMQAPVVPTPSTSTVQVTGLDTRNRFTTFTGSFGGVTLSNFDISAATDRKSLAALLQAAFRDADAGRADISVIAQGDSLMFSDLQGKGGATKVNLVSKSVAKATVTQTSGPTPFTSSHSVSTLAIDGLDAANTLASVAGTFGGVTIGPIDTSALATLDDLATTLQGAFRAADNNRPYISVAVKGSTLVFTDISGRGGATAFDVTGPASGGPSAQVSSTVAGSVATAATGGAAVTSTAFVEKIVQKYTESQFNKTVGNVSQTLRLALYAQQSLPKLTNWYSVIADPKLARVVETAVNLPADSFGAVPVDQQVAILKTKMDIKDFKDPAKLTKLLDRFVAISSVADITSGADATNGISALLAPLRLGDNQGGSNSDSMIGATSAAIFSVLYSTDGSDSSGTLSGAGLALQLLNSATNAYG